MRYLLIFGLLLLNPEIKRYYSYTIRFVCNTGHGECHSVSYTTNLDLNLISPKEHLDSLLGLFNDNDRNSSLKGLKVISYTRREVSAAEYQKLLADIHYSFEPNLYRVQFKFQLGVNGGYGRTHYSCYTDSLPADSVLVKYIRLKYQWKFTSVKITAVTKLPFNQKSISECLSADSAKVTFTNSFEY